MIGLGIGNGGVKGNPFQTIEMYIKSTEMMSMVNVQKVWTNLFHTFYLHFAFYVFSKYYSVEWLTV